MSLANAWCYTKTVIDWPKFEQATHNQYRVVSCRPYSDKKGVLPDGISLTLQVVKDDYDYGVNKEGKARENNIYQNFDVTVLSRSTAVKKGDFVQLLDFDSEHSFAIGFDLILRFRGMKVLQIQAGTKPNA